MATDFSRTLSLLRQEKGISQRKAAAALGVSQALLSHYENGIREPGLSFVAKACDYYHVSADYILGRTNSRDGSMIEIDDLYDSSSEKGSLKGSIMATLQKKLIANTAGILFDYLGKSNDKTLIKSAGDYLTAALYQLLRPLYRKCGGNESLYAITPVSFDAGAIDADMLLSRVQYSQALEKCDAFADMTSESITAAPGLGQSAAQVLHNTDERVNKLIH